MSLSKLPQLFNTRQGFVKCFSLCKLQTAALSTVSTHIPELKKLGVSSYEDLHNLSIKHTDKFWGTFAKSRLDWIEKFTQVSDCDLNQGKISWFTNGKINVSANCLDRHASTTPNKVALIWEKDESNTQVNVTYKELLDLTCKFANTLLNNGVQKGDRVAIYMPVSPVAVAGMLACARIGAVHTVVFAGNNISFYT